VREAQVSVLIPTHALPPLSYKLPEQLEEKVKVGSLVVAPLSGYSRLGVVTSIEDGERATEDLRDVFLGSELPEEVVELCRWTAEATVVPLSSVIRMALPPGMNAQRYRVLEPLPDWPWQSGTLVSRTVLRRALDGDGLKAAEKDGRVELSVQQPERPAIEWAYVADTPNEPDLSRAPRQRELYGALRAHQGRRPVGELLSEAGATRPTLRALVKRGAVTLEKVPQPAPVLVSEEGGSADDLKPFVREAGRVVDLGGAWIWRMPAVEQTYALAAVARAAIEGEEKMLVLVPEIDTAEDIAERLQRLMPAGSKIAAYHSELGQDRAPVYEEARSGRVDVLVGTRSAALIPMPQLGAICVVDESNESHRAEPGYEGLPIHVREIVRERARIEGAGALFLSPYPSLRLYAGKPGIRELPPRPAREWPSVRILDIKGSGVSFSTTLLESLKRSVEEGRRVGVIVNRLGYATSRTCNSCGAVRTCPRCNLPLAIHSYRLVCNRCGYTENLSRECSVCGSTRFSSTGLAVERVREGVAKFLGQRVGLITAAGEEHADARIAVGTPQYVTNSEWDDVAVTDVDALLQGSSLKSVERAFGLVYDAASSARSSLLVQTRFPEHYALQAALHGDYPAFAKVELPRLKSLGYPPYGHLASLNMEGREDIVRRAVESELRPSLESRVVMSHPVPLSSGKTREWRVLIRSSERTAVLQAGSHAARLALDTYGLKTRIEIDPEEI
jgi:primosomal protein N' (replication factor Y)